MCHLQNFQKNINEMFYINFIFYINKILRNVSKKVIINLKWKNNFLKKQCNTFFKSLTLIWLRG